MRRPPLGIMAAAAAASSLRLAARGGAAMARNAGPMPMGAMGWQFAPLARPRRSLGSVAANGVARRGVTSSMNAGRANLVMWGEEDAPKRRDVIPSSKFSTEANSGTRQRRPARRSRPSDGRGGDGGGGSWYDDDDGASFGRERQTSNPRRGRGSGGWDDGDDDWFGGDYQPPSDRGRGGGRGGRQGEGRGRGGYDRPGGRGRGRGGGVRRNDSRGRGGGGRGGRGKDDRNERGKSDAARINLKRIESAGYQHLYGIAPVLNALKADVRDFDPADEDDESEDLLELQHRLSDADGIDDDFSSALEEELAGPSEATKKKKVKPEALPSPQLFVQEGTFDDAKRSFRSHAKKDASNEIMALAKEMELLVAEVDKGVLNTLCGNRPHQGFVLRCGGLEFEPVRQLPEAGKGPKLWLALDEVVDPQNLGALLRSAFFLGHGPATIPEDDDSDDASGGGQVGILVCSKNSSPLTPTVSAASAGALEFMTIYSTSNLPRLLKGAADDGWRILGAAAEVPGGAKEVGSGNAVAVDAESGEDWYLDGDRDDEADDGNSSDDTEQEQRHFDLHEVETGVPTILVLGSEGRGLRTLVSRACTGFVSIPGGSDQGEATKAGVDSLNVSVTGGILLWQLLSR